MKENYLALLICILTDTNPTEAVEYMQGTRKAIKCHLVDFDNYQIDIEEILGGLYEKQLF